MASDLTDAQIVDIRRNYLRDEWTGGNAPFPEGISQFNKAHQKNFFTNDQIKAFDVFVSRRWQADLDNLEAVTVAARLVEGDVEATADIAGAAERRDARYHLIAALGLARMADDPGYAAVQTVKGADIASNRDSMKRQAIEHMGYAGITIELER